MTKNRTSQAVEKNEGYSNLKPVEWFCIRQKYKRMEEALEIYANPITYTKGVLQEANIEYDKGNKAREALSFDPLKL